MRLIDADKLKADLEKVIVKNGYMDCLDCLRIASLIDAQPTAYDVDECQIAVNKQKMRKPFYNPDSSEELLVGDTWGVLNVANLTELDMMIMTIVQVVGSTLTGGI